MKDQEIKLPLAVVISLRNDLKRREFIRREFNRVGIGYRFFDATDGDVLDCEWILNNVQPDLRNRLANTNDPRSYRNTIACADSHRRAQRWVSQQHGGQYFIVFEDDAVLERDIILIWPSLREVMIKMKQEVIFLGYSLPDGASIGPTLARLPQPYEICGYPATKTLGAFGYLLTSAGAALLLQLNQGTIQDTADNFHINDLNLSGSVAVLRPKIVSSGYLASSIRYPGRDVRAFLKRLMIRMPVFKAAYSRRQRWTR